MADAQPTGEPVKPVEQVTTPPAGVPESWRDEFKSVIAQRDEVKAKLRTIEEANAKAQADEMAKRGEFEKLANERQAEVERLKAEKAEIEARADRSRRESDLRMAAKDAGVRDLEDIMRLVNTDDIKDFKSAEAAVSVLKTSKPYLFADATAPGIAGIPIGGNGGARSKAEWLSKPTELSALARSNPKLYAEIIA